MAQDISGFGLQVNVIASNTFPVGFTIDQFADDADPFDFPAITIAETSMDLNGTLLSWSKANPLKVTLSVVAGSEADINLAYLLEANRVGRYKQGARDSITLVGIYPNGRSIALNQGKIIEGAPGNGVSSAGRLKSKTYTFAFENKLEI